jgi:hypothetical protein
MNSGLDSRCSAPSIHVVEADVLTDECEASGRMVKKLLAIRLLAIFPQSYLNRS